MTDTTESQLIEAAIKVVVERGYAGATTRRIADEAGVNEVTLFRKFGSKARLLLRAFQREVEHFRHEGVYYSGDLEADLARVVAVYSDIVKRRGRVIPVIMTELMRRPELHEGIEFPLQIVTAVTELIARYQAEGKLVQEPPMQATLALLGPILVGGIAKHINPRIPVTVQEPQEHVRRYLDGRRGEEANR